jgi:hypothetical protein
MLIMLKFFNLCTASLIHVTGKETVAGTSLVNPVEAEMVLRLCGALSFINSNVLPSLYIFTGKETVAGTSLVNRVEAEMVLRLYGALSFINSNVLSSLYIFTGKETVAGTSLVNRVEAEMVLRLYGALTAAAPHLRDRPAIGVISPYKAQVQRHTSARWQGCCEGPASLAGSSWKHTS